MGYNVSADSNCCGVWRFENGALGVDSRGNGNTLTASASPPTVNTGDYKDGAASGDFECYSEQYLRRIDADLSAGFPGKYGETTSAVSIIAWIKLESEAANATIVFKEFAYWLRVAGTQLQFYIGAWEGTAFSVALQTGRWYHIGVTYDVSTHFMRLRVWDDTAGALLAADTTATYSQSIGTGGSHFWVGDTNVTARDAFDGLIDGLAVFNDVLTPDEIDACRAGLVFGYQPQMSIVAASSMAMSLDTVSFAPLVGVWTWPVRERLGFLTQILAAHDRTEQRIAHRCDGSANAIPTQEFATTILLRDKSAVRRFEAALSGWQKSGWPVPVWPMSQQHTAALPAGSSAIAIDTRYADYRADGYAMIWQSDQAYEIVTVASIADSALTLDGTTQNAYTGPKWVLPCRLGKIIRVVEVEKLVGDGALVALAWEVEDVGPVTGYSAILEYDGMTVLTVPSYLDGDSMTVQSDPDVAVLGGDTGPFVVVSNSTHNEVTQPHVWYCRTLQEAWELRQFLHDHRGRQKAFLVPTFKRDIELTRSVGAADTSIYVVHQGYTRNLVGREYLAFRPAGATIIPRKVTGISVVSDGEEKIDLASAPGAAFAAGSELSWVDKCRLASDAIELKWEFRGEMSCSTTLVRIP